MNKFAVIIQCRLNSKRFPNKILKKIDKKYSILEFLIQRIKKKIDTKNIIIAAVEKNKSIINISKRNKTKIFFGSEKNVLQRYFDATNFYNLDYLIRITSDCPLVDPNLIMKMRKDYLKFNLDYIANTLPPPKSRWPDGSDIEIISAKCLNYVYKTAKKKEDKEHVTNFIWKNKKKFKTKVFLNKNNLSKFKYSIDYPDDLKLVRIIVNKLKFKKQSGTAEQICRILTKNNILMEIIRKNKLKYYKNRKDLK